MTTPTYKQQFDKLTEAYISGRMDPFDCKACFIGNMFGGDDSWQYHRYMSFIGQGEFVQEYWIKDDDAGMKLFRNSVKFINDSGYTQGEIFLLESAFLRIYTKYHKLADLIIFSNENLPIDEDALFKALEETLESLKQIHISKGEVIEDAPVFTKRELLPA